MPRTKRRATEPQLVITGIEGWRTDGGLCEVLVTRGANDVRDARAVSYLPPLTGTASAGRNGKRRQGMRRGDSTLAPTGSLHFVISELEYKN